MSSGEMRRLSNIKIIEEYLESTENQGKDYETCKAELALKIGYTEKKVEEILGVFMRAHRVDFNPNLVWLGKKKEEVEVGDIFR
jgi:hypothetical protein